jgi:hypothetical protein
MKKSRLRELIKEEVQRVTEGTWALPKNSADAKKARKIVEKTKDALYSIYGDDILFDHLDAALDRMDEIDKESK